MGRRMVVAAAAVGVCWLMMSCQKGTPTQESIVEVAPAPTAGPCFLFLRCDEGPADGVEVSINGELMTLPPPTRSGHSDFYRVTFTSAEYTWMTVRLLKEKTVLYQAEFQTETAPGDMIDCHLKAQEEKPAPEWGPPPSYHFPAEVEGIPGTLWGWFGQANKKSDSAHVYLVDADTAAEVKERAIKMGCQVVRQERDWMNVVPAKGMTVVELALEMERWPGVKDVQFEVRVVF